jgi:hypothetical protein
MVKDIKEQQELLQEAVKTIGSILRSEFEINGKEVPDHIRKLLDQLDAVANPKKDQG